MVHKNNQGDTETFVAKLPLSTLNTNPKVITITSNITTFFNLKQ